MVDLEENRPQLENWGQPQADCVPSHSSSKPLPTPAIPQTKRGHLYFAEREHSNFALTEFQIDVDSINITLHKRSAKIWCERLVAGFIFPSSGCNNGIKE
jgi:hypothetical protein